MELSLGNDSDAFNYSIGSVRVALGLENPFDEYLLIEKNQKYVQELRGINCEYKNLEERITIKHGDANTILTRWVKEIKWNKNRAVVFLDPWGMQVRWETIEALGKTKGIDLWYLFPLGQGVNRLLTKSRIPSGKNADLLTAIFGTEEWKQDFYQDIGQFDLFTNQSSNHKSTNFSAISRFIIKRLETVFAGVTQNPLPLLNSRNNPIFLLIFAAANEKGAPIALKIASDILKME